MPPRLDDRRWQKIYIKIGSLRAWPVDSPVQLPNRQVCEAVWDVPQLGAGERPGRLSRPVGWDVSQVRAPQVCRFGVGLLLRWV